MTDDAVPTDQPPTNGKSTFTKMRLQPGGVIQFPLRDGRVLTFEEPSWEQIAAMHDIAVAADAEMPQLPEVGFQPTAASTIEEKQAYLDRLNQYSTITKERTKVSRSIESPYGRAVVKIVKLLSGVDITPADCYAWVVNAETIQQINSHVTVPLGGGLDLDLAE